MSDAKAANREPEHDSPDFVHLHVHTDYSLLDGCSRIDRLFERANSMKMRAVSITDHGNLYGLFDFWNDAKKAKIKPLLGCELYLVYDCKLTDRPERSKNKRYHMGVLAKNFKGYQNLTKLVSDAHTIGFFTRPRTDMEQLALHAEGLIGFTGCMQGVVPQFILAGEMEKAREALGRFVDIFGKENYFVEIMDHGLPEQQQLIQPLLKLAEEFGLKVVATNDVHYVDQCHNTAHDAMVCIQTGAKLADEKRMRYTSRQFYLKSQAEMLRIFGERPDALLNTVAVAEMCEVKLPVGANNYPVYRLDAAIEVRPRPKFDLILDGYVELKNSLNVRAGKAPDFVMPEAVRAPMRKNGEYLLGLCKDGLLERYGVDYDSPEAWADDAPRGEGKASPAELCRRIDFELSVIAGTGFVDYFLIVWDFINWARVHGIPVGPGRGSGAGSIIAYALKITDIDPIRFGLLFERFLNPERVSAPDFDIDFCMRRRDQVVDYVRKKYGADRVANIITFGTLGAKMVVRDLARVHDVPYADSNRLAKLIPDELDITLEKALKDSPDLRAEVNRNPIAADIMKEGEVLEGMVRNTGKHACGMIIADKPLTEIVPVTLQEGALTTQYAKDPVDKLGLLKMDFLGLKTLTVIDDAVQFVRRRPGLADFDIEKVPLEDKPTFDLLNSGKTIAVFQLESEGMQSLCRQFSIASIDEIIALIALYRPGPMQFIPQYVAGKKDPRTIKYAHELMIPIAKETYGILVYQEQVMEVAKVVGGYTLGGADMLRRAMGKKIAEEMAKQKSVFIEGAAKTNGLKPEKAGEIFDVLAKFAEYGFNKSHSAAYGFLSYRTAYLKANFPTEFMAGVLSNEIGNSEKIAFMVGECEAMGLKVLGPDVNVSENAFTPVPAENSIRFGLGAAKGVGEAAANAIVAERVANGPFKNFVDFMERMPESAINSRVIEHLIKSGAFDFAGDDRRHLLDSVEAVKSHVASVRKDKAEGQGSLFDMFGDDSGAPIGSGGDLILRRSPLMTDAEKLGYEKELLGFYLSGHPLDAYAGLETAAATLTGPVGEVNFSKHDRWPIRLCGIVTGLKKMFTKEKEKPRKDGTVEKIPPAPWAAFTLSTRDQSYEVNVFPEAFETIRDLKHPDGKELLAEGSQVIVDAELSWRADRESWSVQAFRMHALAGGLPSLMKSALFVIHPVAESEDFLQKLAEHLHSEKGTGRTKVRIGVRQPDGRVLKADTANALAGHISPEIVRELSKHPACSGILLEAAPPTEKPPREWGGKKK